MKKLSGLHLLLTYKCNYECDHCFVWGGPRQTGTMSLRQIDTILRQAKELRTIEWIYFEGGEPFLYYPVLAYGVRSAADLGFRVGVVTNAYWATHVDDALEWLRPFAGAVQDLSISDDVYHGGEDAAGYVSNAGLAAEKLDIPRETICIAAPESIDAAPATGQLPPGEWAVRFRGRAAEKLAGRAALHPWDGFDECPYENLREPGRLHVDPLGNLHVCQGISIGNLFDEPLDRICDRYDPDSHPVVGPLLGGGPAKLARRYAANHGERHADACHLCCETRRDLRARFPEVLGPDQMYGA